MANEYAAGEKLGQAIRLIADAIALIDDTDTQDVLDGLVSKYVADRIVDEASEGG